MADTKISALAAATTAAGANEFAINEAGTSKKLTVALLQAYLFTAGDYANGTFTIVDGSFAMMTKRLILTGSQRATLQGTARLRIN